MIRAGYSPLPVNANRRAAHRAWAGFCRTCLGLIPPSIRGRCRRCSRLAIARLDLRRRQIMWARAFYPYVDLDNVQLLSRRRR